MAKSMAKGVTGVAKSTERALVKPVKHRVADAVVPAAKLVTAAVTGNSAPVNAEPPHGAQLEFKHEGVYGVHIEGPAINVTHNAMVVGNKILHAYDKVTGKEDERNRPEYGGLRQRPKREFNFHGPHLGVKEGRVKVTATGLEKLNRKERTQQRARAKIVQAALTTMDGQQCTAVATHRASGGHVAEYAGGGKRWIGSRGEHVPFAAFDAIKSTHQGDLKPPPIGLLSGTYEMPARAGEKQGTAWRLELGRLYVWDKSGERPAWKPMGDAQSLAQHADGNLYAHIGDTLMRCNPLEPGKAALTPVPALQNAGAYQSIHMMPPDSDGEAPKALAVDHHGRAFHLASDGHATLLAEIPGLKNLVPVPGGEALCGHTSGGKFIALSRMSVRSEHEAFAQLATQIPLEVGHSWHVQSVGYEGKPGDASPALHAILASDQGHRISMIYDRKEWIPQYKADATILQSDRGLKSEEVRPETRIQYDQDTHLAINTHGEMCIKHRDIGRWDRIMTPEGEPLQNVQKIVTGANELAFGKRVYALIGEGANTSIHEIDVGGRLKQLPAHSGINEVGGGAPPAWHAPNRLTARPGPEITSVVQMATEYTRTQRGKAIDGEPSSAPPSPIVDLAADRGRNVYRLTEHGTISKTAPAGADGQALTRNLPEPRIGNDTYHASQITISGDNGRLFALARKTDEDAHAPMTLLEFVPAAPGSSNGTAASHHPVEGSWLNRALEWKDAKGRDIPDNVKATARLSTSLLGTPMIEVTHPGENGSAPSTERYRILQVPVRETSESDTPPRTRLKQLQKSARQFFARTRRYTPPTDHRFTLQDVRRSGEDPRVGMDNNDAMRPPMPGTKRTTLKWTLLGGQFSAFNRLAGKGASAGRKAAHYAAVPLKSVGRYAFQLGRLLVQAPPATAARLKQDIWGRNGLAKDYAAVRDAMKNLADVQQPITTRLAQITPPRPEMLAHPQANHVVETTLGHCLEAIEQICITARVLEPDRQTEHKPGRRRAAKRILAAPLNKATPNSRDALPKIKRFWESIGEDKLRFFTPTEQNAIAKIKTCVGLLEKNKIKLWDGRRGALSNFTAYHGSHSIQSASLATSMQHFAEAVQIRTFGTEKPQGANAGTHATPSPDVATALSPAADAALKEIEANQKAAIPNQLARCGFSGWHAYEAMVEAVTDLRAQINNRGTSLTPGSPLYELVKTDFDLQKAKTMPKDEFVALVANKWAEAVCSLQPRTVFGWTIEKGLGAGTYLGSGGNLAIETAAAKLSFGGIANLGGARRSFIGVEAIGSNHNQTEQGPVIVFMTRGMSGTASAGVGMGISPLVAKRPSGSTDTSPLHNEKLEKHFGGFAAAMAEGTHTRAKGGALVLEPQKVHEFARMLFDEKVEPLALMKMGVNEGGIGLNLHENDAALRVNALAVARQDWLKKAKEFGPDNPPEWGAGKRAQFNGMIGARAGLGVEIYHKTAMELHLRLGFVNGNGFEYQGDSGPRISAAAAGYLFGGSAPANIKTGDDNAYVASARAGLLALDIGAAELNASWNSHYKRTADFVKPTGPVSNDEWKKLLGDACKVPGLRLEIPQGVLPDGIGAHNLADMDVTRTEGRTAMHALLDAWSSKLQDMETAVCHENRIEHIPDPGDRARMTALLNEARGVDEHLACQFMVNAEAMFLKSHAAQYNLPLIQDSARIELNLPNTDPTARDVNSNLRLGSVMKKAREVEAAIPGIKDIKAAYASLPGYNETRLVFEMDPRKINLANRLMILGVPRKDLSAEQRASVEAEEARAEAAGQPPRHDDRIRLSGEQIMDILKSEPMNYHCVVHCAKNNDSNSVGHAWSVGLTMRHAVTATEERFLAETHIKHGWGARAVRAELLPTAQDAMTDAARGRSAFTRAEIRTARQTQPAFEPPVRTLADVFAPARPERLPEALDIDEDNDIPESHQEIVSEQASTSDDEHVTFDETVIAENILQHVEPEIVEEEIDPIALLAQVEAQKAARKSIIPAVEPETDAGVQTRTFQTTQSSTPLETARFSGPAETASPSSAQPPEQERTSRNRKFLGMNIPGTRKPSKTKAAAQTPPLSPPPPAEPKTEHKKKFGFGFGKKTKESSGSVDSGRAQAQPQRPAPIAFDPKSEQAGSTSWGKLIAEGSGAKPASSSAPPSRVSAQTPQPNVDQGWGAMFNDMAKKAPTVPAPEQRPTTMPPRSDDQSWKAMFKEAAGRDARDSTPTTGTRRNEPEKPG